LEIYLRQEGALPVALDVFVSICRESLAGRETAD